MSYKVWSLIFILRINVFDLINNDSDEFLFYNLWRLYMVGRWKWCKFLVYVWNFMMVIYSMFKFGER